MNNLFLRPLALLSFYFMSGLVQAEIITFQFEGVVTNSNKLTAFPIGQAVIGRYSFNSTVTDGNAGNTEQGTYDNVTLFTFTSGELTGIASSETSAGNSFVEVIIVNRDSFFDPHRYEVFSPCANTPDDKCGVEAEGEELRRMRLVLQDSSEQAIQTIDLPISPPDINDFDTREFGLIFEFDATNDPGVKFTISSLVEIETPEPPEEVDDSFLLDIVPAIIDSQKLREKE